MYLIKCFVLKQSSNFRHFITVQFSFAITPVDKEESSGVLENGLCSSSQEIKVCKFLQFFFCLAFLCSTYCSEKTLCTPANSSIASYTQKQAGMELIQVAIVAAVIALPLVDAPLLLQDLIKTCSLVMSLQTPNQNFSVCRMMK